MKWMIASDIHGSALYCRQMLARFEAEKADRLLLLGDILYHGPRNDLPAEYDPKAVIAMLNPLAARILCVRGNCEAEVDQMVLSFPVMADYAVLDLEKCLLYATHGHRFNGQNPPPLAPGDILLQGHTHIPCCEPYGDFICMNPGSVGIPKDGSRHGYMTLENGTFLWKDMEGTEVMKYCL